MMGAGRWEMALSCCHRNPLGDGAAILSHMAEAQGGSREAVGAEAVCVRWRYREGEGFLNAGGAIVCRIAKQAPRFHLHR